MTSEGVAVELDGWWGDESALVKKDSLLYKLKMELIDTLMKASLINSADIDNRNKTPHIRIANKMNPKSKTAYDVIHGKKITLANDAVHVSRNVVELKIGDSGLVDAHMTLVYKRNIGDHKDEVVKLFNDTLAKLTTTVTQ